MRQTRSNEAKLNNFLEGIINARILSKQITPLIALDTTSVPTLKQINNETKNDRTVNGKILYETSTKLLDVYAKSQSNFVKKDVITCLHSNQKSHLIQKKAEKKININIFEKDIQSKERISLMPIQNNQNENTLNYQTKPKNKDKAIRNAKEINIDCKLIEIIRPQYKKSQIGKKSSERASNFQQQLTPIRARTNRVYGTDSSDSEDIPIVRNKINSHRQLNNKLKRKSVSPKHENKSSNHLNNISAISKNYQTQTDHSFQIDLYGMGFIAERPKLDSKPLHHVYLVKGQSVIKDKANRLEVVKKKQKVQSLGIQQEEPWECDEQEIEEQIRQIDEKLRYKTYYNQRTKTEVEERKMKRNY